MHAKLRLFFLAWILAGCDRSGSTDDNVNGAPGAVSERKARRAHVERGPAPGTPEALLVEFGKAEALKSSSEREKAFAAVAWNALEIDPDLAEKAFQMLPKESAERRRLILHQAMRLAESDLDRAIAWADGLDHEGDTSVAKGMVALTLAESDPVRAANLLSESGIEGRDFDVVLVQVIQRWAAKAPLDAAAWVLTFPSIPAREAGFKGIAEQWLRQDPPALFDWIEGLKDADIRSETVRATGEALRQQPAAVREEWLQDAPEGIRTELQASDLEEEKESSAED